MTDGTLNAGRVKGKNGWLVKLLRAVPFVVIFFSIGGPNEAAGTDESTIRAISQTVERARASAKLDEERAYFDERGVEYGGYIFSVLDNLIVKIPSSEDKINANARTVMEFPDKRDNFYDTFLCVNDGVLYINFAMYMDHGGLYRMTSDDEKPEFVMKAEGENAALNIIDSKTRPRDMKFLIISEGDAGEFWGEIYCYFPLENITKKLTNYYATAHVDNFLGITKSDEVLTVRFKSKTPGPFQEIEGVTGIDKLTMDARTKEIRRKPLLDSKR
ncbi:MAG: hypothetical protein LBQ56_05935, partial [Synergistaceae bacterium]|nr:hypothetical protein [Synergistaceae bacterium]